ncbi:c-type cytochrome [Chachezhania sediminis]|uniref:c-type cytochrome n=1 Tax=Chachezhania sediminis TaxID=2599291 RepID=UPI00131D1E5D|nr:c-type cytochrome [Chachezhania sediminis]
MSKYRNLAAIALMLAGTSALAGPFGLGRPATEAEIEAWDVSVHPDGSGLPEGSGDVMTGEEVFSERCAVCHGEFAEGVGNWPKLAGGDGTLADKDPVKTVGSYWPYLSTTWDYVHRSMPFGAAQTLTPDEVYAIVAYILYSNDLVDDDFVLTRDDFLSVEMPNAGGFIVDDRDAMEVPMFTYEPCMTDCKPEVEITMRAAVLDVTPEDAAEEASDTQNDTPAGEAVAAVEVKAPEEPAVVAEVQELDAELVAKGENVFKKCKACHQVGDDAKNRTGPVLNGIVGAPAGHVDGYKYSKPMQAAADGGLVWTDGELASFLANPKKYMKGTKMSFPGLKSERDTAAVIAYLQSIPAN